MQVTLNEEFRAMLWMLLCGVLCGVQYDIVCILRVLMRLASYAAAADRLDSIALPGIGIPVRKKRKPWSDSARSVGIAVGDIFFAFTAACTFSVLLSHALYGIFRWFCLLAAVVGYVVYRATIGKGVLYISEILAGILRILLRYLGWLILLPLRVFLRVVRVLAQAVKVRLICPVQRICRLKRQKKYTKKIQSELRADLSLS